MTHTDYTKKILNIEDENILSFGFLQNIFNLNL